MVESYDPVLPPAKTTRRLGATYIQRDGVCGTDFVFYADKEATDVELCLFDKPRDVHESSHLRLAAKEPVYGNDGETVIGYLWHGFAEGVLPGALYGFRVHGDGHNPNKLLVDPCADAVTHDLTNWEYSYHPGNHHNDSHSKPKARVIDWHALRARVTEGAEPKLGCLYPYADTIICETHVKGATKQHPDIAEDKRGTYAGLMDDEYIRWVKEQGVTSIELQPVATHGPDYWGYSTMVGGALHTRYAATDYPEVEFVEMVRKLKQHGIEVILDVVPNHTIEGGDGAAANLRVQDRRLYRWDDVSGCGNTRDFHHPINRRMFIEELRHWRRCGVSGFRIDLAGVLGCEWDNGFNAHSAMMEMIHKDPELSDVKIYGEPWHLKGQFKGLLAHINEPGHNHVAEWNNDFRNLVQFASFNKDHDVTRGDLIQAISGSHNRFNFEHADPQMGINYVLSHDGPTLYDAVSSPNGKQNWANGEQNRDGNDIPRDWYWPDEQDRERMMRFSDMLLTISQGGILRKQGNESAQSQGSNTNPWNQDNETTWLKWGGAVSGLGKKYGDFVAAANKFRMKHASLRRGTFFTGREDANTDLEFHSHRLKDVTWLDERGTELSNGAMDERKGFGMLLSGDPGNNTEQVGFVRRIQGRAHEDPILVLVNQTRQADEFTLPEVPGIVWKPAFSGIDLDSDGAPKHGNETVRVEKRSVQIFEGVRERTIAPAMQHARP